MSGGKNLFILGFVSVFIALATSLFSLYLYHTSGDIYLDCSLPESDCPSAHAKKEEEKQENYKFSDDGNITKKDLEDYLKYLETEAEKLLDDDFASDALDDASLGI